MSRLVHRVLGVALSVATCSVAAGGCVEAEGRLYIELFTDPVPDEGCKLSTDESTAFDIVDCSSAANCSDTSFACAQVQSQLTPSLENDSNNNKVETSTTILYQYELRYIANGVDMGGVTQLNNITAKVEPLGEVTVPVVLISPEAGDILAAELPSGTSDLVVGLRFYGRTTGGLEIETPETFRDVRIFK